MRVSCLAIAAALLAESDAIRLKEKVDSRNLNEYSYSKFVQEFGREVTEGTSEHRMRAQVFDASLAKIRTHNSKELRLWTAGVNKFMDWTSEERKALNGYKPNTAHRNGLAALQTGVGAGSNATLLDSYQAQGPPLRNQGNCGSCWAISAAEAVEAQLMQNGQGGKRISAQALVDCVPNPQHCGGSGGCDGATGELAYRFMTDVGIPMEDDLPYDAHTDPCPVDMKSPWPTDQRVRLQGWNHIQPNNKAQPLMQSLVQNGPTVVAVDANDWFDYDRGIFDGCSRDATLGHAVLATGYGEDSGKKYWTIQNSWGSGWGEQGHIRLLKHEDEDGFCGQDKKPSEGEGCDGGPSEVTVCGMCGILYDPIVPVGASVEGNALLDGAQFSASPVSSTTDASEVLTTTSPTTTAVVDLSDFASELPSDMSDKERKEMKTLLR